MVVELVVLVVLVGRVGRRRRGDLVQRGRALAGLDGLGRQPRRQVSLRRTTNRVCSRATYKNHSNALILHTTWLHSFQNYAFINKKACRTIHRLITRHILYSELLYDIRRTRLQGLKVKKRVFELFILI